MIVCSMIVWYTIVWYVIMWCIVVWYVMPGALRGMKLPAGYGLLSMNVNPIDCSKGDGVISMSIPNVGLISFKVDASSHGLAFLLWGPGFWILCSLG